MKTIPLIISVFIAKLHWPLGFPKDDTNFFMNTGKTGFNSFAFSSFDGMCSLIALNNDLKIVTAQVRVFTLYVFKEK